MGLKPISEIHCLPADDYDGGVKPEVGTAAGRGDLSFAAGAAKDKFFKKGIRDAAFNPVYDIFISPFGEATESLYRYAWRFVVNLRQAWRGYLFQAGADGS